MAAPKLTPGTHYAHFDTTAVYFVPTIVNTAAPTRAELNAGTDLSDEITEMSGWTVTSGQIPTPVLGKAFTANIPGRTTADDSAITFLADLEGDDIRTLLPRNTNGHIVLLYGGDVESNLMSVFEVRVMSNGVPITVEESPATVAVQFSITDEPSEAIAVPAA